MTTKKKPELRLLTISNCRGCPHKDEERTPGAGYAIDWICKGVSPPRKIAGYIEWPSEEPKDGKFPGWCPLPIKGQRKKS